MIIDVHGHVTHPDLFKRFPMPPALADIEGMLEQKAAARHGAHDRRQPRRLRDDDARPGLDNYAQPLDQLKLFHDWLADTVGRARRPARGLRLHQPVRGPRVLEQTARTVREGGFVGLIVNSSVSGEYLDSEGADDFFAMAAELGVPVFLHPGAEPVGSDSVARLPARGAGEPLLRRRGQPRDARVSGRLDQYPDLKLVGATAGGGVAPRPQPGRPGTPRAGRPRTEWSGPSSRQPERLPSERLRRHRHRQPAGTSRTSS